MSNNTNDGKPLNPQNKLISALSHADAYSHEVSEIRLIETHISWVILTGPYAYKIKKPVNFGFLDFSTLDKRRRFCDEELRLNRRLAPMLYLDVVPICEPSSKPPLKPAMNGTGEAIEYAVKMLQFHTQNTFDELLAHHALTPAHIEKTAQVLAQFHSDIARADESSPFGTAKAIRQPAMENFDQLAASLQSVKNAGEWDKILPPLRQWTAENHDALITVFQSRKRNGFIRECHGDLHLRNIVIWEEHVIPFDCIEFNDNLRWIDVISELAFLLMDFDDHQQPVLARQLLNSYLSLTGDYEGLQILRYYQVYRAMVRAKVAGLRLGQNQNETPQQLSEISNYLHLAESYTKSQMPMLIITHGLSGSGKTYLANKLSLATDLIHLRSDVERKRYFGLTENSKTQSKLSGGIYSPEVTQHIYDHLLQLSRTILNAGFSVLIDATFLQRQYRDSFKALADELKITFSILHCETDEKTLQQRLQQRQLKGTDASEADELILAQQQKKQHSLDNDEECYTQVVQAQDNIDITRIASTLGMSET